MGAAPPGQAAPGTPADLTIPADNPLWSQLGGFLPNPGAYGEASWDDVRMRVVQHVATIGRDRARARAAASDFAGCAEAYRDTARRITAIPTSSVTGAPIRAALRDAATRDAAVCDALAHHVDPPVPATPVAALRARHYAWTLHGGDHAAIARDAAAIVAPDLSLDAFGNDFEARHALRVKLVEAWADVVDPLAPTEPWGYWEPAEVTRTAAAIGAATTLRAAPVREPLGFTAEALGALPTGDTLVDTAGFPGPRAIGKLAKLSLEDPAHRRWLDTWAARLDASDHVPADLAAMVGELDATGFGSRFYNIKQARNETVRVLASRGDYAGALTVLRTSWPLHDQDWACPDRAAILHAIEGRLLLAAGDPGAEAMLDTAMADADAFLAAVAQAPQQPGPVGPPPVGPPGPARAP
jgi:hypothetical protein